ncbi:MAG: polysulfide reductase NrfD [Planctomycetota bacterium]|nr:polysulfide reductase NrfD [Planctomycetota bacterium]
MVRELYGFVRGSIGIVRRGNRAYYAWVAFLLLLAIQGVAAYYNQARTGLILTNMRDPISWAFYIGNFTFLVGVGAAAVMLVIPAYIYDWKPIKEVVVFGELLAIAAMVMCLLFVLVDMGRPDRFWHLIPFLGSLHLPTSLLSWDAVVLNVYLLLNLVIASYLIFCAYRGRHYNPRIVVPLVIFSIPMAISIHTVTAFLYNGMAARPYWNSAILAPRFLASAFCSGPAVLLILFQIVRRTTRFDIKDEALHKVAELMAYAMGFNLFLTGAEIFKEYYSDTQHLVHIQYLFSGIHGRPSPIAIYGWSALALGVIAFLLFVVPATRKNFITMNLGCLMIYGSVYIEKGIALLIPGYTPDVLGQVYEYVPSVTEVRVSMGIFGIGFLLFTLMVKVALATLSGRLTAGAVRANGIRAV